MAFSFDPSAAFPVAEPSPADTADILSTAAPFPGRVSVLLVGVASYLGESITRILVPEHPNLRMDPCHAADALACLQAAPEDQYGLVIAQSKGTDEATAELCRALDCDPWRAIPVIVLLEPGDSSDIRNFRQSGVHDICVLPARREELSVRLLSARTS